MKKREAGMELLRIVAMLMIITLHYLDKGGILPQPSAELTAAGYAAWGLEALCVPAVNVYVLISAYFLAGSDYKPGKVMTLWLQVIFYSVGIPVVLLLARVISISQMDLYRAMNYIFPIIEEHYWFVTAYILMYLLAPLMNGTLRELSEKTFRRGLLLLLALLSVSVSVLPVRLPIDRMGYDALWFLCLYLIGAYIRLHGDRLTVSRIGEKLRALRVYGRSAQLPVVCYLLCCMLIFASLCILNRLYGVTGSLADFINRQYQYNSIFCLLASISLFEAFRRIRIPEGRAAEAVRRVSSASFGVYLIHEHLEVRYRWPEWLGVERFTGSLLFLPHWIVSILAVYVACMAIDFIRQRLFEAVSGRVALAWMTPKAAGRTKRSE